FYLIILSKFILFKYLTIPDVINHITFNNDGYYWNSHNFIPLKTITYYLFLANDINFNIRIENLTGNVIGFIPFGFLLPLLLNKFHSFKKIGLATFCLSLIFELLQLIFRIGSFDVDDLILNTLGGMIGYLPIKLFGMYIKHRRGQRMTVIN
ncbi:MAG: VanZ family protein, partial [Paenisporosarcina sp.]|nr:VanZ family protein [Paenisporosarcina sp.]